MGNHSTAFYFSHIVPGASVLLYFSHTCNILGFHIHFFIFFTVILNLIPKQILNFCTCMRVSFSSFSFLQIPSLFFPSFLLMFFLCIYPYHEKWSSFIFLLWLKHSQTARTTLKAGLENRHREVWDMFEQAMKQYESSTAEKRAEFERLRDRDRIAAQQIESNSKRLQALQVACSCPHSFKSEQLILLLSYLFFSCIRNRISVVVTFSYYFVTYSFILLFFPC